MCPLAHNYNRVNEHLNELNCLFSLPAFTCRQGQSPKDPRDVENK